MKKFKIYLRVVSLLCVLLCFLFVITACGKGKETNTDENEGNSAHAYVVNVKDGDGASVENVGIRLFDSKGNELTWMPVYTNLKGSVEFEDYEENDCYVQIASVPKGYGLDAEKKYTFDDKDSITIVLEQQLANTDLEIYEATIGEGRYVTFTEAISAANTSKEDVTVVLAGDITISEIYIENLAGKNITIDGNGHSITTKGGNNALQVRQAAGVVEFKNMTILHQNTGTVIGSYASNTVNLTDVVIRTNGDVNNYCLINLFGAETTIDLNLTRVDVKMNIATKGLDNYSGFIRTGNDGADQRKTVSITMTECNIDVSGASARTAIMVMPTTTADISLTNTTITTKDTYAIRSNYQPIDLHNVTFKSNVETYTVNPIQNLGNVTSDKASQAHTAVCVAKIDDAEYYSLVGAALAANTATTDVIITLVSDLTIDEVNIKNANGKNITIDGNGHTITTEGGNNAIRFQQDAGTLEVKNVKIEHKNTGTIISSTSTNTVSFTDVKINATGETNNYCLFNLYSPGDTSVLNLTRVDVKLAIESKGKDSYSGVIRTGNANADDTKTVLITLTDCNIDATGAAGRTGIMIMSTTTAYVVVKNSTIKTKDIFTIRANGQAVVLNNCKLSAQTAIFKKYLIENDANVTIK